MSQGIALAALLGLSVMTALPFSALRALVLIPLLALLFTGLRPSRLWSIAAGSIMLVYFSHGVMELLTNPAERLRATIYTILVLTVFFGAMDGLRRR